MLFNLASDYISTKCFEIVQAFYDLIVGTFLVAEYLAILAYRYHSSWLL